jgi:23S rRNA pseudouridine2605 synthase
MEDEPRERIAKALSRAGVASRREAERMIEAGRVRVAGRVIETPATLVAPTDRIEVDGRAVAAPEAARLWLHHKPAGLVTTASDERGRPTVFDRLPPDMPRVMSVGRLDLSSEGLLLLTNDGGLKRRLELPSTGWLRRYRVRVHGAPSEEALEPLRRGLTLAGERFQPMTVALDRQQGSNAWLTIALREGRNREIRRAMEAVGLRVNRLIRVSYGPFQLGSLEPGAVEAVKQRVLRDQLGSGSDGEGGASARSAKPTGTRRADAKPRAVRAGRDGAKPARAADPKPQGSGPRSRGPGRPGAPSGGAGPKGRGASGAGKGPRPGAPRRGPPPRRA